jgi:hypothetical protein
MGSSGTLKIIVVDQSGATVEGANLELKDLTTNDVRTLVTQQLGAATFSYVPLGTYRLTVSKPSFKDEVIGTVVIQGGRVTDLKIALTVGTATETITVDAAATTLMETSSNALATTIDLKSIQELPLAGRDVSSLAQLSAGYSGSGGRGTWNGLPLNAESNTIDGVVSSTSRMKFSGNVTPGLEARLEDIQEMTVQTGQLDLSQGMGMAAMQVNFVTKRGANDYHGGAFEDFQNTALNANTWLNNASKQPRSPIILNNFGGNFGGHIIKDKLFFFGSFSMSKRPGGYLAGPDIVAQTLTPLAQSGIYTDSNGNQINLLTIAQAYGLPTTNAAINTQMALINKNVAAAGKTTLSSDPNLSDVTWPLQSPITKYYPAFRADYNASQKVRMDFSFEDTKYNQPAAATPLLPGSDFANQSGANTSKNYTASFGIGWTISPTFINQFRVGYYYNYRGYSVGTAQNWLTQPQVSWGLGSSGQGFNLPIGTYYPVVNFADGATWVHRSHTVSFGLDFYREQDHYYNAPDGIPNVSLGLASGDPATNDFNTALASEPAGDISEAESLYATLIGRISSITPVGSGFPYSAKTGQYQNTKPGATYNLDELQKGWGLYAQDAYRLNPHLTVNYGLRWDFTGDDHDLTGAYHAASSPSQIYGPSLPGQSFNPGVLSSNLNPAYVASGHQCDPYKMTPQPTIGVAWNPSRTEGFLGKLLGGGNTVIRAGFDLKRFTEPYQYFWNNAANYGKAFFQGFSLNAGSPAVGNFTPGSLTYTSSLSTNAGLAALPEWQNLLKFPTAYAVSLPQSLYTFNNYFGGAGFDPHIKQPYLQEWNLGIQRQLGRNNILEVRYLGHRTLHQWISTNTNEVNIFENGFLKEFQAAQNNLKLNNANAVAYPQFANSFAYNSAISGEQALPIMSTAFGGANSSDFSNGQFITLLNQGAAGALAGALVYPTGNNNYICNLVGSSLSPCASTYGYTTPGPYPVNFFQSNPYLDPYQGGASASYMSAQGYGNYHALQVEFRQKQWHGMQFDVNYTWSHTLGIQPDRDWEGNVTVFSIRNLRQSYGPTYYDLRHVVHASGTYDLPFGHGKAILKSNGLLDKVVGGWTLGTIFTHQSGLPFRVTGGYNTANDYGDGGFVLSGVTAGQLQSGVGVYQGSGAYKYIINPALLGSATAACSSHVKNVCQNTAAGTFGSNLWLFGPRQWNDDLSLTKNVPIGEKLHFSLQAEFLDIFNHPNWASPGPGSSRADIQSSRFGRSSPSNFNDARHIELRANFTF